MKKQYFKQVARRLPRRLRAKVLRDLEELFACALENGETEQQLIARLGTPTELAQSMSDLPAPGARRRVWLPVMFGVLAFLAFSAYGLARVMQADVPAEAIGFAQGSTDMIVSGSADLTPAFLAAGVACCAAAIAAALWRRRR